MKRAFTLLALGIAVACGSSAGDILDEMPAPGDIMDDVIDGVTDVPSADAQDATSHPVTCDKERVVTRVDTYEGAETLRIVTTTRFAEVEVPDFKSVGIERCDPLGDDYGGIWGCAPDIGRTQYTCEGILDVKPCSFSWGAGNHVGNTVIVDCTSERRTTYADRPELNTTQSFGYENVSLFY